VSRIDRMKGPSGILDMATVRDKTWHYVYMTVPLPQCSVYKDVLVARYNHPPLIEGSIYRYSHNMSPYPNDRRSSVNRRRAVAMFTGTATSIKHSGSAVVQSYTNVRCFSSHFATFWVKAMELWDLQWKSKQMFKFASLTNESLNDDVSLSQLTAITGGWLYKLSLLDGIWVNGSRHSWLAVGGEGICKFVGWYRKHGAV
jgi:hypothetical protein